MNNADTTNARDEALAESAPGLLATGPDTRPARSAPVVEAPLPDLEDLDLDELLGEVSL